jgi:hypothetical protein
MIAVLFGPVDAEVTLQAVGELYTVKRAFRVDVVAVNEYSDV